MEGAAARRENDRAHGSFDDDVSSYTAPPTVHAFVLACIRVHVCTCACTHVHVRIQGSVDNDESFCTASNAESMDTHVFGHVFGHVF